MKITSLAILLATSTMFADSPWFIQPTISQIFPLNSGGVYHGMPMTINYKNGYAAGLDAGRYFGAFKLYMSGEYYSFRARQATVQTPFGLLTRADNDLLHGWAVLANADYTRSLLWGFKAFAGGGAGVSWDGATCPVFDARTGLSKSLGLWSLSAAYGYRWTQGTIYMGHISIDEPRQERLTFALIRTF